MICLTFDIEERFHSHLTPADAPRCWRLHDRIARLIDYLVANGHQATFFVVGELADRYPRLIRRMAVSGFEVASHSYRHLRLDRHSRRTCRDDISRAKDTLEAITGKAIYGYRAPSWSARLADHWLWDHLQACGFRYDASLFPFRTHLYGSFSNPLQPFRLRPTLVEIPPSAASLLGLRIPFGGGFYFRLYPLRLTKYLIKHCQQAKQFPVLYFHPWDFTAHEQIMEKDLLNRFIGNLNVKHNWKRFTKLIAGYPTGRMIDRVEVLRDIAEQPRP